MSDDGRSFRHDLFFIVLAGLVIEAGTVTLSLLLGGVLGVVLFTLWTTVTVASVWTFYRVAG